MSTKIAWCEETWNPETGCEPISEGCQNCYARKMAQRLKGRFGYPVDEPFRPGNWRGDYKPPSKQWPIIDNPYHWIKPRKIFVCSMGDLFHDAVTTSQLYDIWQVMERCPMHRFLLLTKRPSKMQRMVNGIVTGWKTEHRPHIWLGITAENQKRADERIPMLLEIPAAVRWVSLEPLLGPVNLEAMQIGECYLNALTGEFSDYCGDPDEAPALDWIVVGAESGQGRRPCKLEWVQDIVGQCKAAGVPCFVKQISLSGKVEHDIDKFPPELQVREYPNAT